MTRLNLFLPFFPSRKNIVDVATGFNCTYFYDIELHLRLKITIKTVSASKSPRLILEFKALGEPAGSAKSNIDVWYEKVHDANIIHFLEITSQDIQQTYWIPEKEPDLKK